MADLLDHRQQLTLWSLRQTARFTGMSRDAITRRVELAGLAPDGQRQGHPVYDSRRLLPVLFEPLPIGDDGRVDPERLSPRERRDWYDGEKVRMALARESGELVTLDQYRDELNRVLRPIVDTLETLPDVLERKCSLAPDTVTTLQRILDEQREALADRIVSDDDPG